MELRPQELGPAAVERMRLVRRRLQERDELLLDGAVLLRWCLHRRPVRDVLVEHERPIDHPHVTIQTTKTNKQVLAFFFSITTSTSSTSTSSLGISSDLVLDEFHRRPGVFGRIVSAFASRLDLPTKNLLGEMTKRLLVRETVRVRKQDGRVDHPPMPDLERHQVVLERVTDEHRLFGRAQSDDRRLHVGQSRVHVLQNFGSDSAVPEQ